MIKLKTKLKIYLIYLLDACEEHLRVEKESNHCTTDVGGINDTDRHRTRERSSKNGGGYC